MSVGGRGGTEGERLSAPAAGSRKRVLARSKTSAVLYAVRSAATAGLELRAPESDGEQSPAQQGIAAASFWEVWVSGQHDKH